MQRRGGSAGWAPDFGSGRDLAVRGFEPRVRLCADGSEPGACFGFCVSLSLCPSPCSHSISLSLSQNKQTLIVKDKMFLMTGPAIMRQKSEMPDVLPCPSRKQCSNEQVHGAQVFQTLQVFTQVWKGWPEVRHAQRLSNATAPTYAPTSR